MAEWQIDVSLLKEELRYEPGTGGLFWLKPKNKRPAGAVAGYTGTNGYLELRGLAPGTLKGHRVAWALFHGAWPSHHIDHINGDRTDNRIVNLRATTIVHNSQNQRSAHANNKLGLLGVHADGGRFRAQIRVDGKKIPLGSFKDAESAHQAYLDAKRKLHQGNTL